MKPVTDLVLSREPNDCAIVALCNYLGVTYNDCLRAVCVVDTRCQGREGLTVEQQKKVALELGYTLRFRSKVNLRKDYGILILSDHAALIRNGLLFEKDASVYEVDYYIKTHYTHEQVAGILYYPPPKQIPTE